MQRWAQIITYQKRNATKRNDILTSKSAAQNAQFIFLISEAHRNFCNELFDSVEAQRNSAIAERHFRTKLKRKLTSAIEISQHNANTAFLQFLTEKTYNLLKKADIYQCFNRNATKLRSMYKIALLTEKKKIESAAQLKRNKFLRL